MSFADLWSLFMECITYTTYKKLSYTLITVQNGQNTILVHLMKNQHVTYLYTRVDSSYRRSDFVQSVSYSLF